MKKLIFGLISMAALLAGCTNLSEKADPSTENAVKLGTTRVVCEFEVVQNISTDDSIHNMNVPVFDWLEENELVIATSPLFSENAFIGDEGMSVTRLSRDIQKIAN